jgi:hypothetical protein
MISINVSTSYLMQQRKISIRMYLGKVTIAHDLPVIEMGLLSSGLFEKDKLVFSFLLCTEILKLEGIINEVEWNYLLRGGLATEQVNQFDVVIRMKFHDNCSMSIFRNRQQNRHMIG